MLSAALHADVVLMPGSSLPLLVHASRARWVVEHALAAPPPYTGLIAVVRRCRCRIRTALLLQHPAARAGLCQASSQSQWGVLWSYSWRNCAGIEGWHQACVLSGAVAHADCGGASSVQASGPFCFLGVFLGKPVLGGRCTAR